MTRKKSTSKSAKGNKVRKGREKRSLRSASELTIQSDIVSNECDNTTIHRQRCEQCHAVIEKIENLSKKMTEISNQLGKLIEINGNSVQESKVSSEASASASANASANASASASASARTGPCAGSGTSPRPRPRA